MLCERFGISFALAQKWLRTGVVRRLPPTAAGAAGSEGPSSLKVDGAYKIAEGDRLAVPKDARVMAPGSKRTCRLSDAQRDDLQSRVLFMNDDLIVIDKPAGLATQGGPGISVHLDGLLEALRFEKPDPPRLVHRLDKDVSGCLVVARSQASARRLGEYFAQRSSGMLSKIYWALVYGRPTVLEGLIRAPLSRVAVGDNDRRKIIVSEDPDRSITSKTEYSVRDYAGNLCSLVELSPVTGRKHQLRVHCADILRCPIIGDRKYGTEESMAPRGLLEVLQRRSEETASETETDRAMPLMLHARSIVLPFPKTSGISPASALGLSASRRAGSVEAVADPSSAGSRVRITAPLPDAFFQLCRYFGWDSL